MILNQINFTGSIDEHQLAFFTKFTQLAVYKEAAFNPGTPLTMIGTNYAVMRTLPDAAGVIQKQFVEFWGTKDVMNVKSASYTNAEDMPKRKEGTPDDEFVFNSNDGCLFWAYNSADDSKPPYLIVGTGDFRNLGLGANPPQLIHIPIYNDPNKSVIIYCTDNFKISIRHI